MKLYGWITSSLRAKMLTMFVLLTAFPLILVGMITYYMSYETVSKHSVATIQLTAEHLKNDIDTLFSDNRKFLDISKNPNVLRFLLIQNETYQEAKDILNTFSLYRDTYRLSDRISNMMLFNLYGKGISERRGIFELDQDLSTYPVFVELMKHPDKVLIIPPLSSQRPDYFDHSSDDGQFTVSIVSTVKQEITDEVIGYMVITLDASVISNFCNNMQIGQNGYFYIANEKGQPIIIPERSGKFTIFDDDETKLMTGDVGNFTRVVDGVDHFVVYTSSEQTGWKIIGEVPLSEVLKDAYRIERLIGVIVIFTIVFTITLYFFISSKLIHPIRFLKKKMRQAASGFLDAKVRQMGRDEIADLGLSFNTMLDKIKILIENSIKEQELIKIAELRTLQAQINPHFLYNTLDSIIWLAENRKSEEVIEIVRALTTFFRISLSRGRDLITIKDEIEHIGNYLTIQKMRYRDILDYEIQIDEDILNCLILKMTLQPLVENALYHGIKNKRGKGMIRISGSFISSDAIRIFIHDNGAGMSQERLKELKANLDQKVEDELKQDGGFGFNNVHQRLRLYHGELYGLQLESELGVGTTVIVNIPIRREFDEEGLPGGR
ncbi:sensor histidine kinase [Paenibacillus sp. J22TS3]|uniref:cache domain-containing sensor histidine kinase n=1 Tax=Paenibacillus sp. J22TS3 TaxID=2807192 RepID=UPI001B04D511|nr:sensor histidine kinase [Paenibacillus sp. J22TS3]GIP20634.1 histidine kinase [Paenibacillus sp. J22TS3]